MVPRRAPPTMRPAGAPGRGPLCSAPMAEPPDLASLAKRYVDLWQDQLIAMAADPALAESTARLLSALVPAAWPTGTAPGAESSHGVAAHFRSPHAAPGPASAGAAFDERDGLMAELARRLVALEGRLAALEAGIRRPGRRAQPRAQSPQRKKPR